MSTHALLLDELSGKGEGHGKLTVDVILGSTQQLNAIGEYELDLQKKGIKERQKRTARRQDIHKSSLTKHNG